jgi:hypothetical protein
MPKAGGTALAGALGNRFEAGRCLTIYTDPDPSDEQLHAARYVAGHVSISLLDRFERRPYSVAVLREPIDRALSLYSYFRELERAPRTALAEKRMVPAMRLTKEHSLERFIAEAPDLARYYLGNWQARMLGGGSLEKTDERLEDAVAGLGRCDFVGLAERQDESVDWLARRLGWAPLTPIPRTNVTRTRLQRDQISDSTMEALLELTTVDRELYAQAVRLYERRIAEWAAADDVEDRAAGIEDAPLVSDLHFADPIRGSGWLGRERAGDGRYVCWIGHTASARVDLANDRAARTIDVEIGHVVDPGLLDTLRITVNGRTLPHRMASSPTGMIASARLKRRLGRRPDVIRVELATGRTVRPSDLDPSSPDNRELAIAVRRIVLSTRAVA